MNHHDAGRVRPPGEPLPHSRGTTVPVAHARWRGALAPLLMAVALLWLILGGPFGGDGKPRCQLVALALPAPPICPRRGGYKEGSLPQG